MAYVYQVKHKETGEFYIGSKYAIGATPDNTENYLGSIKGKSERCSRYNYLISNERHLLDKTIIGVFDSKEDALKYEIEMHNKLFNDSLCLNGAKQTSNKFSASFIGEKHQMFGKFHKDESKQKMRKPRVNKWEREKLVSESMVKEIKKKYSTGNYSKSDLSREYNVSWGTIKNIVDSINSYKS
jgi:hypothetical protein